MKARNKSHRLLSVAFFSLFIAFILVPTVQALSFNTSDLSLNYLVVTGTPDVVKPGASVVVTVSGKLSANSSGQDVFHIKILVDTIGGPAKTVAQGDLILRADGTVGNYTASVAIPVDSINDTYLYMTMSDGLKSYSQISIALIQNPTYSELETQIQTLQSQNKDLQSESGTASILMYVSILVAVIFIITTAYILALTYRAKKGKREGQPTPQT